MTAKLLIDIAPMNWAYTVLLDQKLEYSFGTAPASSFRLPIGSACERHAVVAFRDAWMVEDCGSASGTSVNGQTIATWPLKHSDVVKIGTCEAVFQNSEQIAGKAERDHTNRIAQEHRSALAQVVERAESGRLQEGELESALALPRMGDRQPDRTADLVWVAQKLATIMSAVLAEPTGRDETYGLMLSHLREAIGADNGFVMIPDQTNTRWIIRAWVGDSSSWTQYERSHPLPLTVTNRAFQTQTLVSNALGDDNGRSDDEPINSLSMRTLNVNSYIAVPLLEGKQRRGVLYFDTRSQDRKFLPRDVKLLELAGNCILEIEGIRQ